MAFTSIGFGQTCSSAIPPRWCARTSFIPSIRSAPKGVFFAAVFFDILLHSFQMSRDSPQFLLLVPSEICFDILHVLAQNRLSNYTFQSCDSPLSFHPNKFDPLLHEN